MVSEQIIQHLTGKGLYVFPVQFNKKPYSGSQGWKDATNDPIEAIGVFKKRPGALIAVATEPSNLIIFDVDNHPDELDDDGKPKDGLKSFREIRAAHGNFPRTWTVKTPSGGLHFYFTTTTNFKRAVGRLAPGIDLLSKGSYVVVPTEMDACKYRFVEGCSWYDMDQPAPCPQWILDWLEENEKKSAERKTPPVNSFTKELRSPNQDGAGLSTDESDVIPEGMRNDTLTRKAGKMRRLGFSEDAILGMLVAVNEVECQPPLPDDELRSIAASIAKYESSDVPYSGLVLYEEANRVLDSIKAKDWNLYDTELLDLLAEVMLNPITKSRIESVARNQTGLQPKALWALVNDHIHSRDFDEVWCEDLYDETIPTFQWLVDGVLTAEGTSLIASSPKSGKSTLIRWLIYCVATGHHFLGRDVKAGAVSYYVSEELRQAVQCLFHLMQQSFGTIPPRRLKLNIGAPNPRLFLNQLEQDIVNYNLKLVVIDPLFDSMSVKDSNSYTETNAALKMTRRVALKHHCHILGVHHSNKASDGRSASGILGSQAIRGSTDNNLWLVGEREEPRYLHSENRYGKGSLR